MLFQFNEFRFDAERGLEGPAGRIRLRHADAKVLQLLLEADGRTVSKDAIVAAAWGGRAVTDDSIFQAVRRLRAAMPAERGGEIVQTVHGRGLRLGVGVRRLSPSGAGESRAFGQSQNVEAAASLTSAREFFARRSRVDLAAALAAARRAVTLDPGFVAGWCGLAEFHTIHAVRMIAAPREAGRAAVAAAEEALALEPGCAPALAIRGWVRAVIELDVARGLADLDESIRVADSYWLSHGLRGWALVAAGRYREAVAAVRTVHELNPWAGWYSGVLAQYLLFAGEHELAIVEAREAVKRFPGIDISHQQHCVVASAMGLHDEAIAAGQRAIELAPDTPVFHTALACALARAGRRSESIAVIEVIEASGLPFPGALLASAYLALGERDRAIEMIRLARDMGSPQFVYAIADPRLVELHGDPRFQELLCREISTGSPGLA